MKSKIVILVSALFATAAFAAAPKVGDQSYMQGKYMSGGVTADVGLLQKVTAYNTNTNVYTVDTTQTVGTDSRTKTDNVAGDDMISEDLAAQIVANCDSGIGKTETIKVAAGTYKTCHATTDSGTEVWIAPVPFGLVKETATTSDGSLNLELSSFAHGT